MDDDPRVDFPAAGAVADLILASRSEPFLTWVEESGDRELLVSGPVDQDLRPVVLDAGERIDVVWRSAEELRCQPAELVEVLRGERPRWRLRAAGVVKRGQRRESVRAPITAPVRVGGPGGFRGTTVDLSEGGMRCVLDTPGRATGRSGDDDGEPEGLQVGAVVGVAATLPDLAISCLAEITRHFPRSDGRPELSLRFIGLAEHEQDEVRRRVFVRLRELRQRGLL